MSPIKHSKEWYMKRCRDCLIEIEELDPENEKRFKILKRKAEKYLRKAKTLHENDSD